MVGWWVWKEELGVEREIGLGVTGKAKEGKISCPLGGWVLETLEQ